MQYYYDKFTAIGNTSYVEPGWVSQGNDYSPRYSDLAKSYSWNSSTGKFTVNSDFYASGTMIPTGAIGYRLSGTVLYRYSKTDGSSLAEYSSNASASTKDSNSASTNTTYSKGSLVQPNIVAEDGTYPANGRHTDGFWYVKGSAVGPLPPGMITDQPYNITTNGGRKLIRLANGKYVAVVKSSLGEFVLYIRDTETSGWRLLHKASIAGTDVALAPMNNDVFMIYSYSGNTIGYRKLSTETGNVLNNGPIEIGLTAVGNVSVEIDPSTGKIHVAYAAKTSARPNSFNIRYSTSSNGQTWSAATEVSIYNATGAGVSDPSIVLKKDGKPLIVCALINGSTVNSIQTYRLESAWQATMIYTGGVHTQTQPSAVVDKDGIIHVTWSGRAAESPTVNNIFYQKSLDASGTTWTTPLKLTASADKHSTFASITVDKQNRLYILFHTLLNSPDIYYDVVMFKNTGGEWIGPTVVAEGTKGNRTYPSTLFDPFFGGSFQSIPPTIYTSPTADVGVYFMGDYSTNNVPTITITSPGNNQTLYENDTINISGDAYDADKDQSVTVFYQINGEQRKVLATNVSQTQITLSKQLTFKDGKLFDGETALTGTLAEGVAHTLKVWAVDSENSQSATIERTFYVVPNRAPLLSVDAVVPAGVVDSDKFKISGTSSDPDANANVKVTKKVNANNPVEIYSGPGGAWEFDVSLAELVVGENTIVIEVIDNYGAKTSKTIKLNKNEMKTPILHAVARYKITPPAGSAKGVLLFIERDEDMNLTVELSMTLVGEQEQYETLTADNTAPMPNTNGIVEDTFYYETTEPKDNIILKISTTRPDATVNHKIHLISGAVE